MPFEPQIDPAPLQRLLDHLEEVRQEILALDVPPMLERWLQRREEARGAHMSTRIEGNPMTEQEVREAFARPERRTDRDELENLNYRDAVRFARQFANDGSADIDGGFIRALHFQIVRDADDYGTAGQYRLEQNAVLDGGAVIYRPPPPLEVSPLLSDLVAWLREERAARHPLVLAAVAHAELINVHPFDDGNGRTARALTVYFASRGGWGLRDFVNVEQVFGQDVDAYYAALRRFGAHYPGQHADLTGWVMWFLDELASAATGAQGLVEGYADGQRKVERTLRDLGLPPRSANGLGHVLLFDEVTSGQYAQEAGVSTATAVADLNKLVVAGQLRRIGAGPSTRYVHPRPEAAPLQR